jgi:hypothetical protein
VNTETRISNPGRRYHHIGIPTTVRRDGEIHLPKLKMHVVPHDRSEFGIEWMRFEHDAPYPELVKTVPHVAFVVDDLDEAIEGRHVIIAPNSPSPGVVVAFIEENGAPIELLQFVDQPELE